MTSSSKQFVIVNPETLEIVSRYFNDVSLFDQQVGSYPHFEIPAEQRLETIVASRAEDESIQLTEDLVLKTRAEEEAWTALRKARDARLTNCDWTMLSDVSLDTKDAWIAYRAALRNLPAITADPRNPDWPVPPST